MDGSSGAKFEKIASNFGGKFLDENVTGAKFKKSILPNPILRELHSEIELMLTNCKKSEKTDEGQRRRSDKMDEKSVVRKVEKLVDVDVPETELIVMDFDANLTNFCVVLEKAFRLKL